MGRPPARADYGRHAHPHRPPPPPPQRFSVVQTQIAFAVSLGGLGIGVAYLPVGSLAPAFLALAVLFTVSSSFSLAKTLRDQHESRHVVARVDEAKLERLLTEHDLPGSRSTRTVSAPGLTSDRMAASQDQEAPPVSDYPAEARTEYAAESRPPNAPPFGPRADEVFPERGDQPPPGSPRACRPTWTASSTARWTARSTGPATARWTAPSSGPRLSELMDRPGAVSVSGGGGDRERERDRRGSPPWSRGGSTWPTRWSRRWPAWRPWRSSASPTWAATWPGRSRASASASASVMKRGDQGVKARIQGREVVVDVVIVVEYGHVVMEVARRVQANVASQTNRMLGLAVVEVNVIVDDVRMPRPPEAEEGEEGGEYGYMRAAATPRATGLRTSYSPRRRVTPRRPGPGRLGLAEHLGEQRPVDQQLRVERDVVADAAERA